MKRLATLWFVWLLVTALPAGAAFGQQTTASLTGQVTDADGEPLPGANVIAIHEPTGTQYGAAANENGRYTILNMRVGGPYAIEASFVGYQSEEETGINLQLGQRRTIDFQLQEAAQELEEVEIVGQRGAVISRDRTGASRNVSEAEIEQLPTIDRSLTDFTRLIPQSGGGNNLAGRNARYNRIQIDGATLDDVFGLGEAVPGSQAGAQPISLDAIQEFNVEIAPYDVRASGFTGGQINAITKSGSNTFEGSVRYLGRNQNFTGDLDGAELGDFQEQYFVGTLGGPIIEDELFFFVTGEFRRQSAPLDTRVGDVQGPNTFQISQDLLSEAGYSSTDALLSDIQNIAQSQYDYEPGGIDPFSQDEDNEKFLAKLDWNVSPDHRLTVRHNYVNARDDSGINRGRNTFAFSNRQYIFRSRQNSSTVQFNSTIGDNMFNEARLVYTRIRDERDVQDREFPETLLQFGDQEVFLGIDRFSQANRLDQDLYEITNNLTWARGDHTITVGTNNEIFSFANLFIQDFYGQYEFRPFTYEDENGEEQQVSAVEAFERGQPSTYRLSYSLLEDDLRPEAEFTGLQLGFYVQDEWQATSNLQLTGGLRVDAPILPQEPRDNPAAREAFGRSTTDVASGNLLWSPRIGFNFADELVNDAFETQIRGGTGVFSGRPPFVWISNQYSNTGADFARLDVNFDPAEDFADADGNYDPTVSCYAGAGDPAVQPRPGDCPGLEPIETTEINLIDDGFRYPQTWRTNLAIDQELPLGFIATLEGLYSNSINEIVYENINLDQTGTSAYGRPLYGAPATFGASRNIVDERFTNALLLKNTNEGYEYSLTAQLQRRVSVGLNGSIAYTYNRAKNVNNGTSSRAISNWQFNENVDVNDPGLGTADFERRHRFLANLTYRFEYADRFATSIGVIYEGLSGAPFSWIYFGDANADGQSFNDLVYVPESEDEVVLASDNWAALDAFIESEPGLNEFRGGFAERNSDRDPWQNLLDLRINQGIATFRGQRVEVTAVVENVLNLLNDDWGRVQFSEFNNNNAWQFIEYANDGRPVISFDEQTARDRETGDFLETANIASRWRLQLGARYTF